MFRAWRAVEERERPEAPVLHILRVVIDAIAANIAALATEPTR
jgi:hypothetical protein